MTEKNCRVATLGGGCFWCLEAVFGKIAGVLAVEPGYCGGITNSPTYREVCEGASGHAEVVRVSFDPEWIGFETLLEIFFTVHDPTTVNRQGHDLGTQYRSVILYHSPEQKVIAEKLIAQYEQIRANQDTAELNAAMQQANPVYILRNHMAQKAIELGERNDISEDERLFDLLSRPFA